MNREARFPSFSTLILMMIIATLPMASQADQPELRINSFFDIELTPGQDIVFHGAVDTLVVTSGQTALFRWEDGMFFLGDGSSEIMIRPYKQRPPREPDPEKIAKIKRGYVNVPTIAQLLAGKPDADDPLIWFEACSTWLEEQRTLLSAVKRQFINDSRTDRYLAALACVKTLQADPLVIPDTVEILGPDKHDADRYDIVLYFEGMGARTVFPLLAEERPPHEPATSITRKAALSLHHLLWNLLSTGQPYTIELGGGIRTSLKGE